MRVAVGGILHETSTFSVVPTTLADFMRNAAEGQEIIHNFTNTKSAMGGYIDAGRDFQFEVIPAFYAATAPAGLVTGEALISLTAQLIQGLKAARQHGPLDGILLDLHGAMISEIDYDAESYILRAVRKLVGPNLPVIVELDLHGNITPEMVSLATVCVAYDEYPHIDAYERGYESGLILTKIVRGGARPTPAIVNIPLLAGIQREFTFAEPMLAVKHLAHDIENERGILNVSYLPGFCFSDIPQTNFAVIVTADNNLAQAQAAANKLANFIWERRAEFVVKPVPVDEAITRAMQAPEGPVILADIGDNPGAGTPADGTVMLEALLKHGAARAVVAPINDPEAVAQAGQAGEGNRVTLDLGGKTDHFHGAPLRVTARVARLTNGEFVHTGPMGTGVLSKMGPSAVLEIEGANGGSVTVLATTYRHQPLDLAMLQSQGIEPSEQQIVVVKSSVHFRAAFTPIAKEIIEVDTPGISNPGLDRLSFQNLTRPIYPLDPDMVWAAR
jgi:microcystin degradation protein MlrC